jgi:hypothetical protein
LVIAFAENYPQTADIKENLLFTLFGQAADT